MNIALKGLTCGGKMVHPGLPVGWAVASWVLILAGLIIALRRWRGGVGSTRHYDMSAWPIIGPVVRFVSTSTTLLGALKLLFLAAFLVIIAAGLFGNQIPQRNAATVLTWNIWWAGLIFAVFFTGSAWCAVCPWDTLANLLVRHRLTGRASSLSSLNLRVPKYLRNLWPALLMFVGLSWLELGVGVTASPYETAILALVIVVLATTAAALFERKAFCRFMCPVGRTVGFYSQLAPVELRPRDRDICADCTTLECYYGNDSVDPCPTHQVMGRMTQNTFCTSCGNCARSCPASNVTWRLRSPSAEAVADARPHWDEAWFMIGLMTLTSFHGISMLTVWEGWTLSLANMLGGPAFLLPSFTILFIIGLAGPVLFYMAVIWLTRRLSGSRQNFKRDFSRFAFVALPLAFAYHLSHNLNHLAREGVGFTELIRNPFGTGLEAVGQSEHYFRMMHLLIPQSAVWTIQAGLMALGAVIALRVVFSRAQQMQIGGLKPVMPLVLFVLGMTGFHMWILMQPMLMRF